MNECINIVCDVLTCTDTVCNTTSTVVKTLKYSSNSCIITAVKHIAVFLLTRGHK